MTPNVRVLLLEVPRLVRDVLTHAIEAEPEMELVSERRSDPTLAGDTRAPDVVIVGTRRRDDLQRVEAILWRWPHSQVLTVTMDGHQASLYQLEPQQTELGELSPGELVNVIRGTVRSRDRSPFRRDLET